MSAPQTSANNVVRMDALAANLIRVNLLEALAGSDLVGGYCRAARVICQCGREHGRISCGQYFDILPPFKKVHDRLLQAPDLAIAGDDLNSCSGFILALLTVWADGKSEVLTTKDWVRAENIVERFLKALEPPQPPLVFHASMQDYLQSLDRSSASCAPCSNSMR